MTVLALPERSLAAEQSRRGLDPIRTMQRVVASLKEQGHAITDLSMGNPLGIPVPDDYRTAELSCIDDPRVYAYTHQWGFPDLVRLLKDFEGERNGWRTDADNLTVTNGASGALGALLASQEHGKVVVLGPGFPPYKRFAADKDYIVLPALDDDELYDAARMTIAHGDIALLNEPNSPLGRQRSPDVLQRIGKLIDERKGFLIWDAVYDGLNAAYTGCQALRTMGCANSAVASSYAKGAALPGHQVGWAAINPDCDDLEQRTMRTRDHLSETRTQSASTRPQIELSLCPMPLYADWSAAFAARERFVAGAQAEGYDVIVPDSGFFVCMRAPGGDAEAFTDRLLYAESGPRIALVSCAGFDLPEYVRAAFCNPESISGVDAALAALRRA